MRSLADWLAEHHPEVGPAELDRQHIRGWLVEVRECHSSNTARGWLAGVRHFCRWLQGEGEADRDAAARVRTPAGRPGDAGPVGRRPARAAATCAGTDFTSRRDAAIVMLFLDGGLRLSELAGLQVADVDLRDRIVYVAGKGRPALSADGVDATLNCRGADAGIADPHPQRLAQPRHARSLRQDGRR